MDKAAEGTHAIQDRASEAAANVSAAPRLNTLCREMRARAQPLQAPAREIHTSELARACHPAIAPALLCIELPSGVQGAWPMAVLLWHKQPFCFLPAMHPGPAPSHGSGLVVASHALPPRP